MKPRLLMACAFAVVAVLVSGCGTAVPDLKGTAVEQAARTLTTSGFKLGRTVYDEAATNSVGTVVAQDPPAGARAPADSAVDLTVAGTAPVPVPSVVGMVEIPARMALVEAGLLVGGVDFVHDPAVPAGSVVSQEPTAGTLVPKGSGVFLMLSRGPQ